MKIAEVERPLDLAAAAEFLGGWKFMRQDLIDYVRGKNKPK